MRAIMLEIAFPYPDNTISASLHIGVLRAVKGHAMRLSGRGGRKLSGVAVPIIAVELNDNAHRGDKGIDTKLIPYQILPFIRNAKLVKQGISKPLKVVGMLCKLFGIHAAQQKRAIRIGIAAFDRTVFDIIGFAARSRPQKRLAAHLTNMAGFVTPLPVVRVFGAAEIMLGKLQPFRRQVERFSAKLASYFLPILALWSARYAVAGQ